MTDKTPTPVSGIAEAIQRYEHYDDDFDLFPHEFGTWVKYADHIAALSPPVIAAPVEAIYQVHIEGESESTWHDATEAAWHTFTEKHRRILAAPTLAEPAHGSREWFLKQQTKARAEMQEWPQFMKDGNVVATATLPAEPAQQDTRRGIDPTDPPCLFVGDEAAPQAPSVQQAEPCTPTHTLCRRCNNDIAKCDWVFASQPSERPAPAGQAVGDALAKALERMDRARSILTNDNPRPECNWGLLDTIDLRKALASSQAERPAVKEDGRELERFREYLKDKQSLSADQFRAKWADYETGKREAGDAS